MVKIDSVSAGEIVISKKTYFSDMVIWWDGKKEFKAKFHQFTVDDVLYLAKKKPEIIVIGTGQRGGVKTSEKARELAREMNIKIYEEKSPKAAEIFNGFASSKKKAVAVIHTD